MGETKQKITFKKKTPVMRLSAADQRLPARQMRFITETDGTILHTNDCFAANIGIAPLDLKGRALLDTVLFDDFKDLINDRAIFNNLSQGTNNGIQSLREGEHTLLIGKKHERVPFHFDWVKGQDNKRYLVACSLSEKGKPLSNDEAPDWQSILKKLAPSNTSEIAVKKEETPLEKPIKKSDKAEAPKTEKKSEVVVDSTTDLDQTDIRTFFEISDDLMCIINSDCDIIRFNDGFFARIGAKKNESFLSYIYGEDKPAVRQCLQSLTNHDQEENIPNIPVEFETRMAVQNGETIWANWRIFHSGHNLYCLGHDITAVKTGEIALSRREQELSEAQNLARMGHWRWTVGHNTIEWSEHLYEIFDIQDKDFVPTLDNVNALLHRRDIGRMMQAFQRAIIEQNDYDMDFRVMRSDGSMRYVRCEGRCELDDDGDVIALYGVMQDITEQTEHEMELREAKDAAEQAYAAKSRFLANMSHELRTPLNAIIGFSDMIQRQMLGPLGSEKYVDYATSIKDSGEHLLDLITDILDMSKIEAGKYELDLEKIQLGAVVKTAVRMIESRAQEGVIELDCQIIEDDPVVIADRRAVMQILLNVLSNAVKFTEPGGRITVTCDQFDNHVSLKIRDTGIGIPANKISAVMRPFEQVSTAFTRNHEGSGLGLAITKELAELHGGMLNLESDVGQGTTVTLRLPHDASQKSKK